MLASSRRPGSPKQQRLPQQLDFGGVCMPPLTPKEMLRASLRATVGGQMKSDVMTFVQLCRLVDPARTGRMPTEGVVGLLTDTSEDFAEGSLATAEAALADVTPAFQHQQQELSRSSLSWGRGGRLPYTRRQLTALFYGADHDRCGTIRIEAFAAVLFPSASLAQLREIVGFVMYNGPPLDAVREEQALADGESMGVLQTLFQAYDTSGKGAIRAEDVDAALASVRSVGAVAGAFAEQPLRAPARPATAGHQAEEEDIDFEGFVRLLGPHIVGQ